MPKAFVKIILESAICCTILINFNNLILISECNSRSDIPDNVLFVSLTGPIGT